MIELAHLQVLSAALFCIGVYGFLARRSAVLILMSIELMFNAVNIALVTFARYVVPESIASDPVATEAEARALAEGMALGETALLNTLLTGQIFAIFIITVAAAEVALGLGIVIAMYRNRETVDVTQANLMRG